MGVRHLIMVVKDKKTVVAQYGQWNGYPVNEGLYVLKFIRNVINGNNLEAFNVALDKCYFVDAVKHSKLLSLNQKDDAEYQQMSRDTSSEVLGLILNNTDDVFPLHDRSDFITSDICEWVYLFDLDANTFEVIKPKGPWKWQLDNLPTNDQFLDAFDEPPLKTIFDR